MIPGKSKSHQPVNQSKNYKSICEALSLDKYLEAASAIDKKRGLDQPLQGKAAKKAAAKANAAANAQSIRPEQGKEQKRKRKMSDSRPAKQVKASEPEPIATAV